MGQKYPLADLGVTSAVDLCVLDPNPPPLSFARDLLLPAPATAVQPVFHRAAPDTTYWQATGPERGPSP